MHKMAE